MPTADHDNALLRVPALDCPDELALIEKGLGDLPGVGPLSPDYFHRTLRVEFDPRQLDAGRIVDRLDRLGFNAQPVTPGAPAAVEPTAQMPPLPAIVGGALLAVAFAVRLAVGEPTVWAAVLAIAATLSSGVLVARAALRALRLRSLDMHVLMTIAAVGAIATGEFFEAATAMFLFAISLWLENFTMGRARRAVRSLVELAPTIAHRILRNGDRNSATIGGDATQQQLSPSPDELSIEDVDPTLLAVGERVLVRPGERIPIDGTVLAGASSVNQAPITGESLPVEKVTGESVYAGTLNGEGSLEVRVTHPPQDTTLAHAVRLVQQAAASRSPTERFVDRFARRYTPAVIALAILIAVVPPLLARFDVAWAASATPWQWFYRSLVLLVIACPCALVISTPVTIVCGIFRGARRGLLIKGGEHLENAGRVRAMAIDKTGTLTTGVLQVTAVEPAAGYTEEQLLRTAASLEQHSEHPLAQAILRAARDRELVPPACEDFVALRGFGVRGKIDGQTYHVGNLRLMNEIGLADPAKDSPQAADATVALVAAEDRQMGRILLADTIRGDARAAMEELKELGVAPIAILTGDHSQLARSVADQVRADEVYAELLPEAKVDQVRALAARHPHMAMVGDGVNDAPALAAAPLGIALGSGASDVALETADVVVLSPHLRRLPELVRLGRRCRRLLAANITIALAAKAAVLILATLGLATMWMAVAADVGASLVVIANGMRLLGRGNETPRPGPTPAIARAGE